MAEAKFKVGDRVFAPFHKYGTVVEIDEEDANYPITVRWDESRYKIGVDLSTFTADGYLFEGNKSADTKISHVESEKYHVGDRVKFESRGDGRIINISQDETALYPIEVAWLSTGAVSTFTKDGYIWRYQPDDSPQLTVVKKDEGTVERMEDALNKKVEDAINPAHYKVEGLPDAIDIINHLMHREQYEGFLWGNILKYAYRYGRKGDKAETAGKIAWYANQLKDLMEEEEEEEE